MAEKLQEILARMENLYQSPPETALAEQNPKPSLPMKSPSKSSEIVVQDGKPIIPNIKPPRPKTIQECLESQDQLSDLLSQTYTMLKKYGEAADATAIRESGFQWLLGEYTIDRVREAFKTYLRTNTDIPTPADIIKILEPAAQPLCRTFYATLLKRREKGEYLMSHEWDYINRYEDNELGKIR